MPIIHKKGVALEIQDAKKAAKVILFTPKFKIEGSLHLLFKDSYRGRLSDHLNSNRTPLFIPITNAKVYDLNNKLVFDTDCIIVNRTHIDCVVELDKK